MLLLDVSTFVKLIENGGRKGPDFGGVLMMRVVDEIADEWAKRKTGNFQGLGKIRQSGAQKLQKHFKSLRTD